MMTHTHTLGRVFLFVLTTALLLGGSLPSPADDQKEKGQQKEKLFVATPLTAVNSFTPGIEGPGCDAAGNIYAVNFARQQTIGVVTPDGKAAVYVELPGKSTGNGIVFDQQGTMYVADYVEHNV